MKERRANRRFPQVAATAHGAGSGTVSAYPAEALDPSASGGSQAPATLSLQNDGLRRRLDAIFAEHFRVPRRCTFRVRVSHLLKRMFDLFFLLVGSAVAIPVCAVACLAIWLDTGRPFFYVQARRVRFGKIARIYKIRTLVVGADKKLDTLVSVKHHGKFLNIAKDCATYTAAGRWLERLWIVELPQLLNIVRGEMSVVGNRPIPDYVLDALGPETEVIERFASPQGLTGYVQCIGRDDVTDEERILLEYYYSRVFERGNVFLEDLKIIAHTVAAYFGKQITPAHFLGADYRTRYRTFFAATGEPGGASNPSRRLEIRERLACPTCHTMSDACAGPFDALDKVPLDESLRCGQCHTTYTTTGGVIDLLPRGAKSEDTPYLDFYEDEYLLNNPDMHLEDTEWKVRELAPLLADVNGLNRSILDVGCGAGEVGARIATIVGTTDRTAVDCSGPILRFAKERHADAMYLRIDAARLPLRNRSYDLSLLIDVIEHQAQPEQVLRELSRVSMRLLIRTPLEDCWYERLRRRRRNLFQESCGHVVHFDLTSVRQMLTENGFSICEESICPIAWSHWKRVLTGDCTLHGKATALARAALRWVMPLAWYRRLFVVNYNALCESNFHYQGEASVGKGRDS